MPENSRISNVDNIPSSLQREELAVKPDIKLQASDIFENAPHISGLKSIVRVPKPLTLSKAYQEEYSAIVPLLEKIQQPDILKNKIEFDKLINNIFNELTLNSSPESLQLFGHIRKQLLPMRLAAALTKRIAQRRSTQKQIRRPVLPEPSIEVPKLREDIRTYAHKQILTDAGERAFRGALNQFFIHPYQLSNDQLKALYHVTQTDKLKNDSTRELIISNLRQHFGEKWWNEHLNPTAYATENPIDELINQINENATRLKNEPSNVSSFVPQSLDPVEQKLRILKKSRVIPYIILEPHEALLRQKPKLIDKLSEVRLKESQFPEGFLEEFPEVIHSALSNWFEKSKTERVKNLREMAKKRGELIRARTVMPSEIEKFLNESKLDLMTSTDLPIDVKKLSKALARKILDSVENPTEYSQGQHGIRLFEGNANFSFPVFGSDNRRTEIQKIFLPVGLWVKPITGPGGERSIELEMIGQKLGHGGFNVVYRSRPLTIDLSASSHPMQIQKKVLRQTSFTQETQEAAKLFLQLPESLRNNPEFRTTKPLQNLHRINPSGSLEASDEEYVGDLRKLQDKLTLAQKNRMFAQIAQTIDLLHQAQWVHRDLKPENILIKENKEVPETDPSRYEAFLADWDLMSKIEKTPSDGTLGYLDQLAINGFASPLTDIYALSQMVEKFYSKEGMHQKLKTTFDALQTENKKTAEWNQKYPAFKNFLQIVKNLK